MSGAIARRLVPLVKAHPRTAGALLLLTGAWMANDGLQQGRKYAPFQGGETLEGRVESVEEAPGQRPPFVASIVIETGTETFSEQVPLSRREAERVPVGSTLEMVRAKDGTPRFVRWSSLKNAGLVAMGGQVVAGIFFAGMLMLVFALWLILFGPSYFAPPVRRKTSP